MSKSIIHLSIITVSYNTKDLTLQTLETVIADINRSEKLKDHTEIFVVDNNSHDDSVDACEKLFKKLNFPHWQVLANQENLGFARANNQAIKVSKGEVIMLLNSDTVTKPNSLEKLMTVFWNRPQNDKIGLLSPTLLNPDGTIQRQGGDLPSLLSIFAQMSLLDDLPIIGPMFPSTQHTGQRGIEQDHRQSSSATQTALIHKGWIAGTTLMIRRELIETIGLLDGNIFMYGEDMEYCLQAKKHGYDIVIHPTSFITHYGQASSSSENAILGEIKGYLYIFRKHFPSWQLPILKLIIGWGCLLRTMIYLIISKSKPASIYQKALKLLFTY